MKVDAHQHYWQAAASGNEKEKGSRGQAYLPQHFKPLLKKAGIGKTVVVQASPSETENKFLLQLAELEATIAGVVGWLDMEAEDFKERWQQYACLPQFIGIRPMIQDLPSAWIMKDRVIQNMKHLADNQFPVDLQANPRHLPYIQQLLKEVPHLRAVIDHLAKPPVEKGEKEPWASDIKALAAYPNIMCKLSGMVPERTDALWSAAQIKPYADIVMEAFGPERVMFGSDWPVCLRSASHQEIIELFEFLIADRFTKEQEAAVYGGNAVRFYKLEKQA